MPITNAITVQGINWKGAWNGGTNYVNYDAISLTGSSYICISNHSNQQPPNSTYWNLLAQSGLSGLVGPSGAQGAAGAQGPAGAGAISLTGWHLLAGPADVYGWSTSYSPTTGAAAVPVYTSSTSASGDLSFLGFTSSAVDSVQSRYAHVRIPIPVFSTGWGNSGIRIQIATTTTNTGISSVGFRMVDATGASVSQVDMVSEAVSAIRSYIISGSQLMPFSHDNFMGRLAFYVQSGATGNFVALEGHFV